MTSLVRPLSTQRDATKSSGSVVINGRFLLRPATGVDRFASEIVRELQAVRAVRGECSIVAPSTGHFSTKASVLDANIERIGKTSGHLWEQLELPRYAGERFIINLCNSGPAFNTNQLVVIHDAATMATPDNFGFAFRLWYRILIARLMASSRLVTTVSKFSAGELTRYFGRRKCGIEVVYESGEHILRAPADLAILARLGLTKGQYVLAVGSRAKNKNLKAVTKTMSLIERPGLKFVSVGGSNQRVFAESKLSESTPLSTGYVSDAALRALYENALCFVFPSYYEGFGLPPLEAMHCSCPVIVSDRASLPEICGDGALYCDPDDPSSIERQVRRLRESQNLREEMVDRGFERARQFSWSRAAAELSSSINSSQRLAVRQPRITL